MHPVARDIWTQSGDRIRFSGVPFDTKAVIVRLPDGGLWLHSPVRPTPERVDRIRALGPVAHLVAPNRIHGAFTADWRKIAPEAQLWVSPRFPERHPGIAGFEILTDEAPAAWQDVLEPCPIRGSVALDDVVFLHKPSRTLILTDFIQRHDPVHEPRLWRWLKGAAGVMARDGAHGGGVPPDLRFSFRKLAEARASRDRILGWDFDRILLPHSVDLDTGGKEFFARATAFLA